MIAVQCLPTAFMDPVATLESKEVMQWLKRLGIKLLKAGLWLLGKVVFHHSCNGV